MDVRTTGGVDRRMSGMNLEVLSFDGVDQEKFVYRLEIVGQSIPLGAQRSPHSMENSKSRTTRTGRSSSGLSKRRRFRTRSMQSVTGR